MYIIPCKFARENFSLQVWAQMQHFELWGVGGGAMKEISKKLHEFKISTYTYLEKMFAYIY